MGLPLTPKAPVIAILYAANSSSGLNTGIPLYEIWSNNIITDLNGNPLTGNNMYVYVYTQKTGGTEYSVQAYG